MNLFQDKSKKPVLILHSDPPSAERLQYILRKKHFTTYSAETFNEALEVLKETPNIAVVILAVGRPDLDHETIIKDLKQTKDGKGISIIVIVEAFFEDLVAAALKAGADDFITGPADPEELLRRVEVQLRLKENGKAVPNAIKSDDKQLGVGEAGLFFTSKDGELLECNNALVKILGYDNKDELLHSNVAETIYLDPEERAEFRKNVEKKGMVKNFRVTFRKKDGNPIAMLISGQVVLDDDGQVIGYRGKNVPLTASDPIEKGILSGVLPRLSSSFYSLFRATELLGYRYEKIARLGIGSFGEVWKVRDVLTDSTDVYVAKIPLSKKLNAKFEKESRILRKLADHAAVPKVREIIEVQNKRVLVQEFVEGKTLLDVIERELEEKEVESIILQLIGIVAHAHKLDVIHRDIKPGNVMVRPDGQIMLLDFGAAKELDEKEVSSTVTGSRPYMSPEQILGKSQKRSDVWALGVVMYVLYTGMFPFYHEVEKVLMDMILELPPVPPSRYNEDIRPAIEQIILTCLEKNPENRYKNAGDLQNAIKNTFPDYGEKILPLY